jgi:hypothetical protein
MSSDAEKIQNLMVTGCRKRPIGSRLRICVYLDAKLLDAAAQLHIIEMGSRSDNPPSLSIWIERTLIEAIHTKKSSQ